MIYRIRLFLFITVTWTLISCKKEAGEHTFEERKLTALLPDLVEAVYRDPEEYLNPPLFNDITPNQEDSVQKNISPKHPKINLKSGKENKWTEVSVLNIIKPVDTEDTATLDSLIKSNNLKIRLSTSQPAYKLNLTSFPDKRYHFKSLSESSLKENEIRPDGQWVYHVGVAFSRIQFDKNKETGILTGTYLCQPKCGIGYIIIIHKTPDGWKIKKVFPTWVS